MVLHTSSDSQEPCDHFYAIQKIRARFLLFDGFRDFSEHLLLRKETGISRKEKLVFRKETLVSRKELLYLVRTTYI